MKWMTYHGIPVFVDKNDTGVPTGSFNKHPFCHILLNYSAACASPEILYSILLHEYGHWISHIEEEMKADGTACKSLGTTTYLHSLLLAWGEEYRPGYSWWLSKDYAARIGVIIERMMNERFPDFHL